MKTKNLFLAVLMLFTTFTAALAQNSNFGIKAGANYSTLSGNTGGETNYLPGFHAGFTSEFRLSPIFSLQPELLYSLVGIQVEYDYSIGEATFSSDQKIKLGYIHLPVMVKYFVLPSISLQAGPQIGYLASAKNVYESASTFPGEPEMRESGTEDIKDQLKEISLGLNFGLGYEFQNNLFLQARYHVGLSDISDYDQEMEEDFEGELDKIKNSGFQVSLGYKF
ncbi:porin family protein [Salinimicrobium terrae]|uniref:porin family protein n=1 Tax=Salinimicrobium terrae TaxID=470866 RepID=UPI00040E945D|nr:porin family protein [Salinimicrobium terrae]